VVKLGVVAFNSAAVLHGRAPGVGVGVGVGVIISSVPPGPIPVQFSMQSVGGAQ